jgi:hypothetical protein
MATVSSKKPQNRQRPGLSNTVMEVARENLVR